MQMINNQIQRDIHKRIYDFVVEIIRFTKILKNTPQNKVIILQLTKSATSMGANDQEADGAESNKDFITKYSIVKKETKETNYWLKIIFDTNPQVQNNSKLSFLLNEGQEIIKIVSKIIINSKNNLK